MSKGRERAERAKLLKDTGLDWEQVAARVGYGSAATAKTSVSRLKRWDYHLTMARVARQKEAKRRGRRKNDDAEWNKAMEVDLRALWPTNTGEMCARILSLQYDVVLSRDAVIGKARRMKLPPKALVQYGPNPGTDDERPNTADQIHA